MTTSIEPRARFVISHHTALLTDLTGMAATPIRVGSAACAGSVVVQFDMAPT